jgi:hypothetical protein
MYMVLELPPSGEMSHTGEGTKGVSAIGHPCGTSGVPLPADTTCIKPRAF